MSEYILESAFKDSKLDTARTLNFHGFRKAVGLTSPHRFPEDEPHIAYNKTRLLLLEFKADQVSACGSGDARDRRGVCAGGACAVFRRILASARCGPGA